MLKVENNGFVNGNVILRDPQFYQELTIKVGDNAREYEPFDFNEALQYMIDMNVSRLDTAYKEVILGGSVISISKSDNCVQRKYRAMIFAEIGHELWYATDADFSLDRCQVFRNIINGKRFRHLFGKLYQSLDKKIMYAYIQDAYDMLTDKQKEYVDILIKRKMRFMGNRCEFSLVCNEDVSEVSVFITPRVQLDSCKQPHKFPLVYNALDHNLTKETVGLRTVFTDILFFQDYESMNALLNLESSAFTTEQYVCIDFIIASLFGRTLKYMKRICDQM